MTPAQWINEFTIKKSNWEDIIYEEKKTYNQFIINLFLSMLPDYIEIIDHIQQNQVSDKHHYNFWKNTLPKRKPWMKWVKGKKKRYSNNVLNIIADYYKVGRKDIIDSLNIITDEFVNQTLSKAGISNKEIKKLLK